MDFAKDQLLHHWLIKNRGEVETVDYAEEVVMVASIPQMQIEELTTFYAAQGVSK